MAIKIPRNLHVAAILFLGAIMLAGFLIKGLTRPDPGQAQVKPTKVEPAPDQAALIAEIRKQNEAALEAERKLREQELAIERTKRELEQRERNLANKPSGPSANIAPPQGDKPNGNDKEMERREAAATSKIIAIRGQNDFGVPGVSMPGSGRETTTAASGPDSSFEDRYRAIRDTLGPQQRDDRSNNERWQERAAATDADKGAVKASPARRGTVVHEGTTIRAVLQSRINSDLPGMITARVLSDIYDTQNGTKLAIPAGSRLVGQYNSNVELGQRRVMAAFHRIILPDGRSLYLKAANGTDNQGTSGLYGKVDNHFWEMLGSQLLVATIAWAAEQDSNSSGGSSVNVYTGSGSGNDLSAHGEILVDAAKKLAKPYENRKPTLTLEPGATFNVMVNQDLLLGGL